MLLRIMVLIPVLWLGACESYDVTVNERRVYTPRPLLTDFTAPDPALRACLELAIDRHKVTRAPELQELNCRERGVVSLEGLQQFTALRVLDLGDNAITDITPLRGVVGLEEVYLGGNNIVDPLPLASLQALDTVHLTGNRNLRCPDRQALLRVSRLQLPSHCG